MCSCEKKKTNWNNSIISFVFFRRQLINFEWSGNYIGLVYRLSPLLNQFKKRRRKYGTSIYHINNMKRKWSLFRMTHKTNNSWNKNWERDKNKIAQKEKMIKLKLNIVVLFCYELSHYSEWLKCMDEWFNRSSGWHNYDI